jgi:aldose 1-epimerase
VLRYTANFIGAQRVMKGGVNYPLRSSVALKTQHLLIPPNWPHFPRTTLMPGQTLHSRTVFSFSTR